MQDILAILIVALAAAFLAPRAGNTVARRQRVACGACSNCSPRPDIIRQLITISPHVAQSKL